MPKFNFNYCKSIFKFLILCLWIKLLLFSYNIQNNLTIIIFYIKMKWRWKGTYIEAGEFGGGYEQITIINRAGGTYKWMDESWKPSRLGSVCVRSGIGQWVVVRVVVVVRAAGVVQAAAGAGGGLRRWCHCWGRGGEGAWGELLGALVAQRVVAGESVCMFAITVLRPAVR